MRLLVLEAEISTGLRRDTSVIRFLGTPRSKSMIRERDDAPRLLPGLTRSVARKGRNANESERKPDGSSHELDIQRRVGRISEIRAV